MPTYLISPPAVERVVPLSKPIGTAPTHVSVSATHGMSTKTQVVSTKPGLIAIKAPATIPTHIVSLPKPY